MKALKAIIINMISAVFPFVELLWANRKIQKKLEKCEGSLSYISDANKIDISILKERYKETFSLKDKFEDKAKSQIFAITVAITVIFGASSLLKNISEKYQSSFVNWIVFILYVASIAFLITAGILAIRLLMHENQISTISLQSFTKDEELRNQYDVATEENIKRNQKRNNYIFTAYQCIRNALICLFVVLIISIIPIKTAPTPASQMVNSQILYSTDASAHLIINNNQHEVETAVNVAENNGLIIEGKTVGFIDDNQQIFIQVKKENGQIFILYIFDYTK